MMSDSQEEQKAVDRAEARRLKLSGIRLASEGRLPEAIEHFDKAVERDKDDAIIYYLRGWASHGLGISLYPSAESMAEKAEVVKRLEKALDDARTAIRLDSDMAEGYYLLGMCYGFSEPTRKAQTNGMAQLCFEAYLQMFGENAESSQAQKAKRTLQRLADAREELWEKEWLDAARAETTKSVADLTGLLVEAGYLAVKKHDESAEGRARGYGALKAWVPKAVVSMFQRWAFEHFRAALEQAQRGNPRAAAVQLLEGLRYQPDDAAALLLLGVTYEVCGYPERAEYFVERGLELQPSDEIRKEAQGMLERAKAGGRKVRLLRAIARAVGDKTDF